MISITIKNHFKASRMVGAFAKSLDDKVKELIARLMTEGYDVASVAFSSAYYAGTNDVTVDDPFWDGDTMVLRANGEAVAFIEFGSGKFFEEYPDHSVYSKLGMSERGEYGKKKGAHPPWRYIGDAGKSGVILKHKNDGTDVVETYGNYPARAMYQASELLLNKEHVIEIAKEVFK